MIVPVCLLFTLFSILFLFTSGRRLPQSNVLLLFVVWGMLVCIATFRPDMADKKNYAFFFNYPEYGERFEIGFKYLTGLIKRFGASLTFFFFFFAGISIALKLWAIRKMTTLLWGSLAVYVSNFFILHDMIQMRCAVASGLLLHAVYFVWKRNLSAFLATASIAMLFHYSAIIIFPLWFLSTKAPQRLFYMMLIPASYLLAGFFSLVQYIRYIPIAGIERLWYSYEGTMGDNINIFNAWTLLRVAFCLFILLNIKHISMYNSFAVVLAKVYAIALSCFVLFSDLPVVSWRISELYMVVEVILLPLTVYSFPLHSDGAFFSRLAVIVMGVCFLYMNIAYTPILK